MSWIYLVALLFLGWSFSFVVPRSILCRLPGVKTHSKKKKVISWARNACFFLTISLALVFLKPFITNWLTSNEALFSVTFQWTKTSVHILFGMSVLFFLFHMVDPLFDGIQSKWGSQASLDNNIFLMIKKIVSFSVMIIGFLLLIQHLGYNITSILAGLGIGGVAVALAAKDTISNFFGSIVILIDRPFEIGDWIHFNETEGTVESVGFRSTQIKTFYDSVISIPNFIIANAQIDNLGKRKYRRTRFNLGITYSTNPQKIKSFIEGIKKIIETHERTKKDYYQVSFSGYADSSLNIFVNLFLKVQNWNEELKFRQEIFLSILELSQQLGVEFAFPSQSLYIEKNASQKEPLLEK